MIEALITGYLLIEVILGLFTVIAGFIMLAVFVSVKNGRRK